MDNGSQKINMDNINAPSSHESLLNKVMNLSQNIWENKISKPLIESWLSNFNAESEEFGDETIYALFLLSNFMYFGNRELREMLRSLYRDKIQGPLLQEIRRNNNNSKDMDLLKRLLAIELNKVRFLGIGNPSESGTHMLYYFRQINDLHKDFFINTHEIFKLQQVDDGSPTLKLSNPSITTYIFLDDLCGSGTQAKEYSRDLVSVIKGINPEVKVHYFSLFAQDKGIRDIRAETEFDSVEGVFCLDDSFKCFSSSSRYFLKAKEMFSIEKETAELISEKYGSQLMGITNQVHWHGYKDSQLLLGFTHNTPDNTLPIIWKEENWIPIFKRYSKIGA